LGLLDILKPKLVQESELRANESGEQQFAVLIIKGIGTSAQFLSHLTGRVTLQNVGTTELTLLQDKEGVSGEGHVLKGGTGAGDGLGEKVTLFSHGPVYVISSGVGGICSVMKE